LNFTTEGDLVFGDDAGEDDGGFAKQRSHLEGDRVAGDGAVVEVHGIDPVVYRPCQTAAVRFELDRPENTRLHLCLPHTGKWGLGMSEHRAHEQERGKGRLLHFELSPPVRVGTPTFPASRHEPAIACWCGPDDIERISRAILEPLDGPAYHMSTLRMCVF